MLSLDEALSRIFAMNPSLGDEEVPLAEATGRYLAAPVHAQLTQPPFDASAMDGYAMASADAHSGAKLTMIGTSQAGSRFEGTLTPGTCARIFTGTPLPKGADTVIMQENVTATGDTIEIQQGAEPGNNVRSAGQDFSKDDLLIKPGTQLTAAHIGLAAAANNPTVTVAKQPKIAILASGDELVPIGTELGPDQIVASNSIALTSLLSPFAQSVTDLGIAPDNEAELADYLSRALNGDYNILITSGGASVGDHDLIQPVLKSLGVEIDFWKIAIRPGKPLMAGKRDNVLVFGLPGNPVSAMVTANLVVLPAVRKMLGATNPLGPRITLPLAAPMEANGPRRHFMRRHITSGPNGQSLAAPISQTDSAHLSSMAGAEILIISAENAPGRGAGELVECIPL